MKSWKDIRKFDTFKRTGMNFYEKSREKVVRMSCTSELNEKLHERITNELHE